MGKAQVRTVNGRRSFKFGFLVGLICVAGLLVSYNFFFQVYKKPAELLSLVGLGEKKSISGTWRNYGHLFEENSTPIISAPFLAALAQVESAGNPLATPKWNIKFSQRLSSFFSPASSSVGLYQFTNGTYKYAKNYCVDGGKVYKDGPWFNIHSCWFNWAYSRIVPSHSIEMASAYLTVLVKRTLGKRIKKTSKKNRQRLAAIIHLCGVKAGKRFAAGNFRASTVRKCGSHSTVKYVKRLERYERKFKRLAAL